MHATTPSIYSPTMKQFTLGGNASAYGASTNSGFGWAYNADNGFAVSSNVVSKQTNSATTGLLLTKLQQVGLLKLVIQSHSIQFQQWLTSNTMVGLIPTLVQQME